MQPEEQRVVDGRAVRPHTDDIPLVLRAAAFVSANRRTIVLTALVVGALAAATSAVRPRKYEATFAFTPSSDMGQGLGGVAGIASQLGVQLDLGTGGNESPAFYAALLESRELLSRTATTTYRVRGDDGSKRSGNLIDLLEVRDATPTVRTNLAVRALDELISVRTDPQTGIIDVKVVSKWPELSEQVAERLLFLVNEFNLKQRQSQATAEREFVQSRVDTESARLEASESAEATFLKHNRDYSNSPELSLQYDRLHRQVMFHQQILTSLVEQLEQARIAEVRNTAVITPIDLPSGSAMPRPRGVLIGAVLGLFFGAFLGAGIAAYRRTMTVARESYPELYGGLG